MQTLTPPTDTLCIGIDIGRSGFHLSLANRDQSPKRWQVIHFEYENPDWWRGLVALIADQPAIVVAEPTGWHYLAPIAALIESQCPNAHLYLINHDASRRIRQAYLSRSNKTDEIDSRALAFVALDIASGREPAGIRSNSVRAAQAILELRMHVNEHARLTKLQTRSLNRIEHWCFSIWPELAERKKTYVKAALAGAITPDQIRQLAAGQGDQRTLRYIQAMIASVPDFVVCPAVVEQSIRHVIEEYRPLPEAIKTAERRITATLDSPHFIQVVQRWRTMPAISDPFIAALLIACRADVLTMTRDEFRAAVGAAPSRSQSGKSDKGKKGRRGYRPVLAGLHIYALQLIGSPSVADNPIRRQQDRRAYLARTKTKLADLLWNVARSESGYHFGS